jgi:RNA polymerase sigma-70 factor (ECF subfamily)
LDLGLNLLSLSGVSGDVMMLEMRENVGLWTTIGLAAMPTDGRTAEFERVRRAQQGDVAAFEELYRDHVGRVFALCMRLSGDCGLAEDLVQDVFVRAWEKLGSFNGRSAFSSWLHRLAVNLVTSRWRGRRRRLAHLVPASEAEPAETREPPSSPGLGFDLERAIAELPPQARMVFVLFDVEGYRHREIARLTGLSVGTSKAHLHRARRMLREVLSS